MGKQLNVENSVISAKDDALFFNAMIAKNGVWQYGQKLDYEIVSANQINIKDGMVTAHGRNYVIYPNEVDSLTIENGVANSQRYDLIVYEVSRTDGIETLALKVIKGTQSAEPVDPVLTQDDTLTSGTIYQMPLYRVYLNGINIEAVDDLRTFIASFGDFSKPNLLANGDFQVNQRGQNIYEVSTTGYTLDKWQSTNALRIEVLEDGVVLTNKGASTGYFNQILNGLVSGSYTASLQAENVTGTVRLYMDGTTVQQCYLKNGVNMLHETGTPTKLNIAVEVGASVKIKHCDLFDGDVAYPHTREPYATAVARCHPISYGTVEPSSLEDGDIFLLIKE